MIIVPDDQSGDRDDLISLLFKIGQQRIQGFCCIFCAIMTQDDRTRPKCFVITDGINDGLYSIVLPVKGVHGPLDRIIITVICKFDDIVIISPIWWTEQKHFISGKFFYFIMYRHKLRFHLFPGDGGHIVMMFTVIAKIMPFFHKFLYTVWISFHPASCHKKSDFHIVFFQRIHDGVKIFRSPGGIK